MMLSFSFTVQIVKVSHLFLFLESSQEVIAARYSSQIPRLTQKSLNYHVQLELN